MKFMAIIFIVLLAGCSSQGNQTTQTSKPVTKTTATPAPQKQPIQQNKTKPSEQKTTSTTQPSSEPTTPEKSPKPKTSKAVVKKEVKEKIIYKDRYVCEIDTIYRVHSAESMKTKIGKIDLKLNETSVTLTLSDTQINGTYEIPLKSRSAFSMIAVTKGMVFAYKFHAQTFHFNTGIGAFKFDASAGGHQGKQMRLSGTCK